MIGSALWRYACLFLAALAVAAVIFALAFRGDAAIARSDRDAAIGQRDAALAEVVALKVATKRDEQAQKAGDQARQTVATHTAESNQRLTQIEVRYRDRIVQVPAVCPGPDSDLMREQQAQADRLSAAEDRLRRVRSAAEAPSG